MVIAIAVGILIVVLFILIISISAKLSVGGDERGGVRKINGKYDVQLITQSSLSINLSLSRPTFWSKLLGNMPLFRIPKSEDAEFNRLFAITTYRDDVLRVIQTNAEFRRTMIQLAKDAPNFTLLCYARNKLTLTIAGRPYANQKPAEAARDALATITPNLLAPFERLPADTARESRAHTIDFWAPQVSIMTMIFLSVVGISVDLPLASGEFPWNIVLQGSAIYFTGHIVLLFFLSKQSRTRLQGITMTIFAALILTFAGMPGIVCAINAHAQQAMITETVEVRGLQKTEPRRGPKHYFILLFHAPAQLIVGRRIPSTSLQINQALFDALNNNEVHRNSQLEITEATGLLGLTYVVDAKLL